MNESFWDGHQLEFEAKQVLDQTIAAAAKIRPWASPLQMPTHTFGRIEGWGDEEVPK